MAVIATLFASGKMHVLAQQIEHGDARIEQQVVALTVNPERAMDRTSGPSAGLRAGRKNGGQTARKPTTNCRRENTASAKAGSNRDSSELTDCPLIENCKCEVDSSEVPGPDVQARSGSVPHDSVPLLC